MTVMEDEKKKLKAKIEEIEAEKSDLKAKIEEYEIEARNADTREDRKFYLGLIDTCRQSIISKEGLLKEIYQQQQQAGVAQATPESLPSARTPCFVNPDVSASNIANTPTNRAMYDVFGLPCSPESYIPNARARALLERFQRISDTEPDIRVFEHSLRTDMTTLHSWKYSAGGSESNICDPNLNRYLSLIKDRIPSRTHLCAKEPMPFTLVMAKQSTQEEHRIQYDRVVVITSEAKGVENSLYAALVQGFQSGSDSAVNMWRRGFELKDTVVPVVFSFSDCFCIFAVYLIPDCYPVIVQLSAPMTYLTFDGRVCIARWGLALAMFAEESVSLVQNIKRNSRESEWPPGLYISESLFFKPLRHYHKKDQYISGETVLDTGSTLRANLELLMMAYRKIGLIEGAGHYFLFPLGVMSYPSSKVISYRYNVRTLMDTHISPHFISYQDIVQDGCPVVVFEHLSKDEWFNSKPPQDMVQSYVNCVAAAVGILNLAGIAHLDLRPANIMWKRVPTGEAVEIRIIDLEDAVPFGFCIRNAKILRTDPRYPVLPTDTEHIPVNTRHNDWFLEAVTAWATRDDTSDFTSFMARHWQEFSEI